ncbi:MAG: tRNA (N6-threonylcarbamoyladenosine(37)-N6)-methyltransferase TrmO [Oceanospirillaceae bacterium]|nr:tRNA (N6-threonylcarbamoyladenosine(37)-N6)-methyltransferase TrmO [Oceanospirillaceae bacterium]
MSTLAQDYCFSPIGIIQSPFTEKFGIPRQPGLCPAVTSTLIFNAQHHHSDLFSGLEHASHLWLIFVFSECYEQPWKAKVRPPRLGGNQKMGVLATRSPYRPNPIGISAVKIERVYTKNAGTYIEVSGADLLNGTPILDIKPYVPYSDCIDSASHALAESFTSLQQPMFFSTQAQAICEQHLIECGEQLSLIIEQILRCDPRPAYHKDHQREYGISVYHWNIRWTISTLRIDILSIHPTSTHQQLSSDTVDSQQ